MNRDSLLPVAYRETPRTRAKREEIRRRILDAALAQLADGGYASASMAAIGGRARLSTGALYRYFPSKAQLFAEVFKQGSERELRLIDEALKDDGRAAAERIGAGVEVFARRALAAPTRAYAFVAEPVDPAVEETRLVFRRDYRDRLAGVLRAGVERRELATHDTDTTAAAIVGALGEALVGPLAARRRSEAMVASLVDFCIRAIPKEESRAGDAAHA